MIYTEYPMNKHNPRLELSKVYTLKIMSAIWFEKPSASMLTK